MKKLLSILGAMAFVVAFMPNVALAQGGECGGGLCGTPNQSGGGCGCGCGSVLVAMTDRGDTYQFADDFDGDGIEDEFDNCPFRSNYAQEDADGDLVGDACDVCVSLADPAQSNIDGDDLGDACDPDMDNDTVLNAQDNCPTVPNADQADGGVDAMGNPLHADGVGDACDPDDDNDGILDINDDCRLDGAPQCDDDPDLDGVFAGDNCQGIANADQKDSDGDGEGDACDLDMDNDDVLNFEDNCMEVYNPSQLDVDKDGVGDAGNWTGGAESCDGRECYVVGGDAANCLDPNQAFEIYLMLVGDRIEDKLQVGGDITVALFSNRLGQQHSWTARFEEIPGGSDVSLANAKSSGATALDDPQVKNSVGDIWFTPDQPGQYVIKVTATLPDDDPMGRNSDSFTIVADVEGEPQGGCAATSGGFAALALGLLLGVWRRRR